MTENLSKNVTQLSANYKVPATTLALVYIMKEQQWYDRALHKDLKDGKYHDIMGSRPEIGNHVYDVLERYLKMTKTPEQAYQGLVKIIEGAKK